jgi:surface polysaccharide O-acyltransferase-like enzyme
VPVFLLISGSLLLDEKKEVIPKKIFSKIKNILFLLIFWSILYSGIFNIILPFLLHRPISLKSFILDFLNGHYHMWYLFVIIGLYLITPYLRSFTSRKNKDLVLAFINISLLMQFMIPALEALEPYYSYTSFFITYIDKFYLQFFCGYTAYYLAGWYLLHIGISRKRNELILYVVGLVSLAITILWVQVTKDYSNAYSNLNIFIFFYSTAAFYFIKNLKFSGQNFIAFITTVSKLSFGMYIIHPLLLEIGIMQRVSSNIISSAFINIILTWFVTFAASLLICIILSKIKGIKKLIRA